MADRKTTRRSSSAAGKPAARRGAKRPDDEAADRAKRAGGVGPHGSAAQRSLRDSAIVARDAAGVPHRDVAAEFAVSTRTVRAVIERSRRTRSPLDVPPMDLIEHALRVHLRLHADFYAMAAHQLDRNPYVALGALRAAGESLDRYLALLTDVGKLPENLALFRSETEMRRVGELMVERLQALEAGEITAADVREFFERLVLEPTTWGEDR